MSTGFLWVCLTHLKEQTIFKALGNILLHTNIGFSDKNHFLSASNYLSGICSVLSGFVAIY